MTNWNTEANQWMTLAAKYIKDDCLSAASSALEKAQVLIPTDRLTKQTDKANDRFSRINDKLNTAYGC